MSIRRYLEMYKQLDATTDEEKSAELVAQMDKLWLDLTSRERFMARSARGRTSSGRPKPDGNGGWT